MLTGGVRRRQELERLGPVPAGVLGRQDPQHDVPELVAPAEGGEHPHRPLAHVARAPGAAGVLLEPSRREVVHERVVGKPRQHRVQARDLTGQIRGAPGAPSRMPRGTVASQASARCWPGSGRSSAEAPAGVAVSRTAKAGDACAVSANQGRARERLSANSGASESTDSRPPATTAICSSGPVAPAAATLTLSGATVTDSGAWSWPSSPPRATCTARSTRRGVPSRHRTSRPSSWAAVGAVEAPRPSPRPRHTTTGTAGARRSRRSGTPAGPSRWATRAPRRTAAGRGRGAARGSPAGWTACGRGRRGRVSPVSGTCRSSTPSR